MISKEYRKFPKTKSIKFKLISFIFISASIPIIFTAYWLNFITNKLIIINAQNSLFVKAKALAENVTRWDDMNVLMLQSVSNLPDVITMDATQQLPIFTTVNKLYGDYVLTVESYTPDGFLVTRGNGQIPDKSQQSDREWFKNTLASQTVYRQAVISPRDNQLEIIFATPIWSVDILDLDSKGILVLELQKKLQEIGLYKGKVDGIYGENTGEAVLRFEEQYNGLIPDGITDPTTWQLIRQNPPIGSKDIDSFPNRKEIVGVAKISSLFTTIVETVKSFKIGQTGFAFLVNEKGQILVHPDSQLAPGNEFTDFSHYPPVKAILNGQSDFLNFVDDWDVRWLSYGIKLKNNWGVIVIQKEAEVLEPNRLFGEWVLKIVGIVLLTMSCLSWILANNQIKPLSDLTVAATNISVGSLTDRVNIKRNDEIGLLAIAFNTMANQLSELINNLEDKVEERTAELATANQKITALNQRLKAENVRLAAEVKVTRAIQQMILPKKQELHTIPNLDISGYMEPADEVGGDYYDVLQDAKGNIKIAIGDVTGHGLESGVLMIMAQTAIRTLLESNQTEPKKFIDTLNRVLYGNLERMKSDKNMSLSILDYSQGTLRLSGQHEQMIVVRNDGSVELIDTIDLGFPIGLDIEIIDFIDETTVFLNPQDVVVLYTDGITEAENMNSEQYGLTRLCDVVRLHRHQSADIIQQAVIKELMAYIGKQNIYDDMALLVIKQKKSPIT